MESPNHGFYYNVLDSTIFVRNRPKSLEINSEKLLDVDIADAYLSVTDSFVTPIKDKIFAWVPWNESRKPTPEFYYAVNKILNWWVFYQKIPTIHLFCDGGTHRSVTAFGAFLRTYFTDDAAKEIVKQNESAPCWSNPLSYIDRYLEEEPIDRLLFRAMNKDRLGRLEHFTKDIHQYAKSRYGENYAD